jgi:hypothetical protein
LHWPVPLALAHVFGFGLRQLSQGATAWWGRTFPPHPFIVLRRPRPTISGIQNHSTSCESPSHRRSMREAGERCLLRQMCSKAFRKARLLPRRRARRRLFDGVFQPQASRRGPVLSELFSGLACDFNRACAFAWAGRNAPSALGQLGQKALATVPRLRSLPRDKERFVRAAAPPQPSEDRPAILG